MDFLHRTWAEIDISALKHNFKLIKKMAGNSQIMAVVKADAYGHSAKDTVPILEQMGADSFAVSNIEEALQLRSFGITKPILVLGYTPPKLSAVLAQNRISQALYSTQYAKELSESAETAGVTVAVHLKLDTGMGRIGFDCRNDELCEINDAINALRLPSLEFEGVFTHFAVADESAECSRRFTDEQYTRFTAAIKRIENAGFNPKYRHCCNSAGTCVLNDKHMDICRPGIILYGLKPSNDIDMPEELIPVMTVKSVVSMVKSIKKGETVSYGRIFTADKDMRVATVTAGYADGYPRRLSDTGYVLINGRKANIIGRICMDQLIVDVTELDCVNAGDEVVLFRRDLPVEELAELCGTINYEIICGISPRVSRIITNKTEE